MSPLADFETLLYWASERGSGSWSQFKDAAANVQQHLGRKAARPWWVAEQLQMLGHIDVDFQAGTWSVARPVLSVLPGMGVRGLLTGFRTRRFLEGVESLVSSTGSAEVEFIEVAPVTYTPSTWPRAIFVRATSYADLQDLADAAGVSFGVDPAHALALAVHDPDSSIVPAAAPADGWELELFNVDSRSWADAPHPRPNGLLRWKHNYRQFHVLKGAGPTGTDHDGWWRSEELGDLYLKMFQNAGTVPFRWHKADHDAGTPSEFRSPSGVPLPRLVQRSLVASSGLPPSRSKNGRWDIYWNVSRETATTIAARLRVAIKEQHP